MAYMNKDKCEFCEKWSYTVEKRRRNTQYVNDESNFMTSCIICFADDCECYSELWADYYSGCL